MKRFFKYFLVSLLIAGFFISACDKTDDMDPFKPGKPNTQKPDDNNNNNNNNGNNNNTTPVVRPGSIGIVGDTTDIKTQTKGGLVIMGGGAEVDSAIKWMIERSGGGDAVVIRATGEDTYNSYINRMGKVHSVETLLIDSKTLANDAGVADIIRNAELLFIAGGDQSDYTGNWKGTKVMDAINYLINTKKVPVGGTSAGAAILGNYYYSGERSSVVSSTALSNPYDRNITLGLEDFLQAPFMENVITDQHFSQRDRQGRLMVFLGRLMKDYGKVVNGIALDERTAVCIDEDGSAEVLGTNSAFFLKTSASKSPETIESNKSFTWDWEGEAVEVFEISAKNKGNLFNVKDFKPENNIGLSKQWWSAINGKMYYLDN